MSTMKENTGPSRKWLVRMANIEDSCRTISAGGMAADLGMVAHVAGESQKIFGRLIEFARRAKGLTVEQLAERADVDVAEIVDIERHDDSIPSPRTVYQLAQALNLSPGKLTEVAGLSTARHE